MSFPNLIYITVLVGVLAGSPTVTLADIFGTAREQQVTPSILPMLISSRDFSIQLVESVPDALGSWYTVYTPEVNCLTTQRRQIIKGVNRLLTPVYVNGTRVMVRNDGRFFYDLPLRYGGQTAYITFVNPDRRSAVIIKRKLIRFSPSNQVGGADSLSALDLFFEYNLISNASERRPTESVRRGDLAEFFYKIAVTQEMLSPESLGPVPENQSGIYQAVVNLGLMDVANGGQFRPEMPATRLEYVVGICRLLKLPIPLRVQGLPYRDVAITHWSAKFLSAALNAKLISPTENFGPKSPISVVELARLSVSVPSIHSVYRAAAKFDADFDPGNRLLNKTLTAILPSIPTPAITAKVDIPNDPSQNVHFSDLSGHWLSQTAEILYRKGIMKHFPPAHDVTENSRMFAPKLLISRIDFAGFIAGAFAGAVTVSENRQAVMISDVPSQDAGYGSALALVQSGLMSVDKNNRFLPARPVTKLEATIVAVRLSGVLVPTQAVTDLPFRDPSIRPWMTPYLSQALSLHLISPSPYFFPSRPISRAELLALVAKVPTISALLKGN
ncbi:S-layer homology domain-containing protein [bacterium]|nr:S-layer homology domain-containing protein [bacterium]